MNSTERTRKYRQSLAVQERERQYAKEYHQSHKQERTEYARLHYLANKEEILSKKREYFERNRDKINERQREYDRLHRGAKNQYWKRKQQEDSNIKIATNLRYRVHKAILRRSDSAQELLGCVVAKAIEYLESLFELGMSWETYGSWHIDHIKPLSLFDLSDPEQQRECFHYTNLQPLWAEDNYKKGNQYSE